MHKIGNITDTKILELKNVTYTYDGEELPVWKFLSCVFFKEKIHVISGPSGCGKSSILALIDGLIPHMYEGTLEGDVFLNDENITNVLPRNRCEKIGLVMQNPESQFCTFTVEEELAFGMENLGFSVEEIDLRIKKVLNFVGMTGMENVDLNNLSGGMKQKIAIASVLATNPSILLLDEPTANLDPESRKQIFELIIRMARDEHITIILVEHNIAEIIHEVDYFYALDKHGQLIINCPKGAPEELAWRKENHCNQTIFPKHVPLPSSSPIIEIQNLNFAYPIPGKKKQKGKPVIQNLSLNIYPQELLAIIGENGVGKSTLMKLLFKVNQPDSGSIKILGKFLKSYKARELYNNIGLVFQNPESQFITNTVWDELMFSLKRQKMDHAHKEQVVTDMLKQFHLEHEREKSPFVLSQGQKRRLSVASMLLTNQQILFLDEPTYGQDFENRQELMKDMENLIHKGITIVMITHDLSLVKQYATRVVEIKNGRVAKDLPAFQYFTE